MALSKQALRQGVHVMVNEQLATKEELIEMSQDWSEKREVFFRKMLQQGGKFKFDGIYFEVKLRERILNSEGEIDAGVVKLPGDDTRF
jgi:hypothetical protein